MKKARIIVNIDTLEIDYPHRFINLHFSSVEHLLDDSTESNKEKASALYTSYDIRLDQARDLAMALERAIQELENFENRSPPK